MDLGLHGPEHCGEAALTADPHSSLSPSATFSSPAEKADESTLWVILAAVAFACLAFAFFVVAAAQFAAELPDDHPGGEPTNRTKEQRMRRFAILIAASALTLTAAACGGDDHGAGHGDDMPMQAGQMPMGTAVPTSNDAETGRATGAERFTRVSPGR